METVKIKLDNFIFTQVETEKEDEQYFNTGNGTVWEMDSIEYGAEVGKVYIDQLGTEPPDGSEPLFIAAPTAGFWPDYLDCVAFAIREFVEEFENQRKSASAGSGTSN